MIKDSRVNPELTIPQMVRICVGPLLATLPNSISFGDKGDIREEDLDLLEKQILGGFGGT